MTAWNSEGGTLILVAGGTGHLGGRVVEHLLRRAPRPSFAVLARDRVKAARLVEMGVEVRIGDYDNHAALPDRLGDIDKLLLISTMAMNRAEQQKRVVDAAVTAGVRHIVYTGLAIRDIETSGVRDLMRSHFETEAHIEASGVPFTFLRNTMYAEAIPVIAGAGALENGISLAGGEGRVPYASRDEMGEAAANVLTEHGHEGKTYDLAGPEAYSYADVARVLSAIWQRPVAYRDVSAEAHEAALRAAGLPDFMVYLTSGTLRDIREGQYEVDRRDLATLLGRRPMSLREILTRPALRYAFTH